MAQNAAKKPISLVAVQFLDTLRTQKVSREVKEKRKERTKGVYILSAFLSNVSAVLAALSSTIMHAVTNMTIITPYNVFPSRVRSNKLESTHE